MSIKKKMLKCPEEAHPENFLNDLKEYATISIAKYGNEYSVQIKNVMGEKKVPFFVGNKEKLIRLASDLNTLSNELKEFMKRN